MRPVLRHWYASLKQYGSDVGTTIFFYAIASLIGYVAIPPLIKGFLDVLEREGGNGGYWLIGIIAVKAIFYGLWSTGDLKIVRNQPLLMKTLKDDGLTSLLELDHRFFTSTALGGLVAKLKRYAKGIERVYDEITFSLVRITTVLVTSLIVVFIYVPEITLFILVWAAVFMTVIWQRVKRQSIYDREAAEADSKTTAVLADIITNAPTVVAGATQKREINAFENTTAQEEKKQLQAWIYQSNQWIIQRVFMIILYTGAMMYAYSEFVAGAATIGTLFLVHTYVESISDAMFGFGRSVNGIRRALADAIDMAEILDRTPEITDGNNMLPVPSSGHIRFENVRFGYQDQAYILDEFNLEIPMGQRVGIVGVSGSGKTTLLRLLQRLYDPQEGAIYVGDRDISHLRLDELRSLIAYVPQEPSLFDRTLLENIRYYSPDASLEEVRSAAKTAQIDAFIQTLSSGYATFVGERGVKLSGGQRQRIAIARALLADRPIVIFDEASSALDNHTEYLLQEQLLAAFEGKTVLIIAHRLSTVKPLDRIVVLEEGRVVEDDPHDVLVEANGRYAQLWKRHVSG